MLRDLIIDFLCLKKKRKKKKKKRWQQCDIQALSNLLFKAWTVNHMLHFVFINSSRSRGSSRKEKKTRKK